jgi:hypothetical protein
MNSISRRTRTCPRTSRANLGIATTAIASAALTRFGPSTPTMATAKAIAGNENSRSVSRISAVSTHRPQNPLTSPARHAPRPATT